MEYLTVKQFAEKWEISERRITNLIKAGRIPGAYKNGMCWNIPSNTSKPVDKRNSFSKKINDKKLVVIAGINSDIGKELTNILVFM